ncbi:hypothetical protein BJ508DRAFT_377646 [Ascobolus immersus RN42]|uniref:F-box domain-containing protein n=1 Tax=Ascobolus immersus RN42 TaxID=1160509 RepID=A0A3N4HZZ2_ASCIM|nr:hypothetical protein BJ508DRAFT_377646 [Ascobolus immersus RN42]
MPPKAQIPPAHPIFTLPTEIRLCIYAQCTTLTLLQLTSTCRQIRYEIYDTPSIIHQSLGYWSRPSTPSSGLTVNDICLLQTDDELHLCNALYGSTKGYIGHWIAINWFPKTAPPGSRGIVFCGYPPHDRSHYSHPPLIKIYWRLERLKELLDQRCKEGNTKLNDAVGDEEMERAVKRGRQDRLFAETLRYLMNQ